MLRRALDTTLDLTVAGGYSRLGYALRKPGFQHILPRMDGKVVGVTGATSGIGLAAARGFAALGATVHLIVRSAERGKTARQEIREENVHADVRVALCDLSSLASARRLAERWEGRLDVLVHNAGVLTERRELSVDGIELTFATNVLGPFALTRLLRGALVDSAPARVINVSSGGMYGQRLAADDLQSEHGEWSGVRAYARSKRAEVVLAELWAQRLSGTGVVVHAMHPGWVETPGLRDSLPGFRRLTKPILRTPEQGADTIVWLGAAEEPLRTSGGFWHDRRRRPRHLVPWTRETAAERERLWQACEELAAGEDPPGGPLAGPPGA